MATNSTSIFTVLRYRSFRIYLLCMGFLVFMPAYSQTAIGGISPDPSAMLDVNSTTKGVLFPRMSTAERDLITNAATGLMIFNTTENRLQINLGIPGNVNWQSMDQVGTLGGLSCAAAVLTGDLFAGQAASGVTASVPFTGGIGVVFCAGCLN